MRIAAKRLRYSLELFRSVFGEQGERQIERVKAIQEELGTLHDHDVRIELIEAELASLAAHQTAEVGAALATAPGSDHAAITATALRPPPDDPRRGLLALLGREHVARRDRYGTFRALWEQFSREGLRSELAALSSTPLAEFGSRVAANGHQAAASSNLSGLGIKTMTGPPSTAALPTSVDRAESDAARTETIVRICAAVDALHGELVAFLRDLVCIQSPTGEEGAAKQFVATRMRADGLETDVWEPDPAPSLPTPSTSGAVASSPVGQTSSAG